MESKASGIHFIMGSKILLGRKAYGKLKGKWAGFGGSVERGETAKRAAVREVLEELYGLENVSASILREVMRVLNLRQVYSTENYSLFVADADALRNLNKQINSLFSSTPFFGPRIPITVNGMVKKFDASRHRNPEFTEIGFFSISEIVAENSGKEFDPYLSDDLQKCAI
jgi:ADP-ribose pyrophosphatase YjhB (NUDIX family)